jgi:hypothetical protein
MDMASHNCHVKDWCMENVDPSIPKVGSFHGVVLTVPRINRRVLREHRERQMESGADVGRSQTQTI